MSGQFSLIQGNDGYITAMGAKAAIFSHWTVKPGRMKPDGKPQLQFVGQFSYVNDVLMNMKLRGVPLQKRVIVQMRTKNGLENVDILGWAEWRYEGGVLYLEDVLRSEGKIIEHSRADVMSRA